MPSSPGRKPRVRLPPAERRAAILTAARQIALGDGLERVTLRSVAERLGVGSGLVSYYFRSIDDLLTEVFASVVAEEYDAVFASSSGETSATERLAAVLRRAVATTSDGVSLLWIDAWHVATRRAALHREVARQADRWIAGIEEIIRSGLLSGEFVAADPHAAAARMMAIVDGLSVQMAQRKTLDEANGEDLVYLVAEHELGLPVGSFQRGGDRSTRG